MQISDEFYKASGRGRGSQVRKGSRLKTVLGKIAVGKIASSGLGKTASLRGSSGFFLPL